MFDDLDALELALLYRALNTERNLIQNYFPPKGGQVDTKWYDQLLAVERMLEYVDLQYEKRYVASHPA